MENHYNPGDLVLLGDDEVDKDVPIQERIARFIRGGSRRIYYETCEGRGFCDREYVGRRISPEEARLMLEKRVEKLKDADPLRKQGIFREIPYSPFSAIGKIKAVQEWLNKTQAA